MRALKAFCTWMVDDRRAAASPLDRLKGVAVTDEDQRGILLPEQVVRLLAATASGKPWPVTKTRSLTGQQRAWMYRFAVD